MGIVDVCAALVVSVVGVTSGVISVVVAPVVAVVVSMICTHCSWTQPQRIASHNWTYTRQSDASSQGKRSAGTKADMVAVKALVVPVSLRVRKVVKSVVTSRPEVLRMVDVAREVSSFVAKVSMVVVPEVTVEVSTLVVPETTAEVVTELGRQGPALTPIERAMTPAMKLGKIIVNECDDIGDICGLNE
jgi:hypothetical protein